MDDQEMLQQFNNEMTDMEKCTRYKRDGKQCEIYCRLGLWSVKGEFGMQLINEATNYFEQYRSDGEYHVILGGPTPVDLLRSTCAR